MCRPWLLVRTHAHAHPQPHAHTHARAHTRTDTHAHRIADPQQPAGSGRSPVSSRPSPSAAASTAATVRTLRAVPLCVRPVDRRR